MPSKVVQFDETPNPNALKCVLDGQVPDAPRSYFRAEEAQQAGDELAIALFRVPGVTNVLIHTEWITVCKLPEASWSTVKAGVREAIERAGERGA